jgi:mono/diheme cytochrome c family protein
MKITVAVMALAGITVFGAFNAVTTVSAQGAQTQWAGVYTEDQAKAGEPLYAQHCASCHGADMTGGEMAPGLSGGDFSSNWNDLTLGDLFERIRISMPQNAPGSLSREQNASILSFILKKGGAPAGTTALGQTKEALDQTKFSAQKP